MDDMTIGEESDMFPPVTVKRAVNRSYRKAGGLFLWPMLEDAQKTSTEINQEYYDYPQNWRPNTIWRVEIDGQMWGEDPDGSPLTFNDYLIFKQQEPTSVEKKWSNQWLRYFISPTPTSNGNLNMSIFGYQNVTPMVNDEDVTIFSYVLPECNEAIVLEAVAILKNKGEAEKSGEFRSAEAKAILVVAYNKIKQQMSKYEKKQPFFSVPNFFPRGRVGTSRPGNFDLTGWK